MWKLKIKFRLGHFTRLQILFGFGTILNLRYTSRLGLSSLALTNMITNMMQVNSSKVQGLLVSIGFTSQVFQIWLTIVLFIGLSFHDLVHWSSKT